MDRLIRRDPQTDRLKLLWIGLGLYTFTYSQTDIVHFSSFTNVTDRLVSVGLLLIVFSLFSSLRPSRIHRNRMGWTLAVMLLLWHVFMSLVHDPGDMLALSNYSNPYSYLVYTFALLLFIPVEPLVRSYYLVGKWLMLIGIPLMLLPLLYYATFTAIQFCFEGYIAAAGLLLMTSRYHKRIWTLLAFLALFVAFIAATILARRSLMMTTMLYMLGGAYLVLFHGRKISGANKALIFASGICLALIAAAIFMLNSKGLFAEIAGRAGDNTRGYVFLFFFWDMLQTPLDIIFGRGIRGVYECPGVGNGYDTTRPDVENGILQLMLKGGVIYILIYCTTLVTAIRQAWRSTNQLCKASIFIIAVQLFDMLPFGLHAVGAKTFIIWMCVSICLSPDLCSKSDDEIQEMLCEKLIKLPKWK